MKQKLSTPPPNKVEVLELGEEEEMEGSNSSYDSKSKCSFKAFEEVAHEKSLIPPNLEVSGHDKSPINLETTDLKL